MKEKAGQQDGATRTKPINNKNAERPFRLLGRLLKRRNVPNFRFSESVAS